MLIIEITKTPKSRPRPEHGNYTYVVKAGSKILAEGTVKRYRRILGWQGLLEDIAREGRRETSANLAVWLGTMESALDANLKERG